MRISKEQRWLRPVVENLVVCIRRSKNELSIPVFSENEIHDIVLQSANVQQGFFASSTRSDTQSSNTFAGPQMLPPRNSEPMSLDTSVHPSLNAQLTQE